MTDTTALFIALFFGSAGLGYLVYGRRQEKKVFFYTGLALMLFPYFINATVPMLAVGTGLLLLPRLLP